MARARNHTVDLFRLLAAVGVIMIHLSPETSAAAAMMVPFRLSVVPFFIVIALYYYLRRATAKPGFRLSDLHFERLVVPYLTWSAIYSLGFVVKTGKWPDPIGAIFFGSSAVHLFFVPLLLICEAQALLFFKFKHWRAVSIGLVILGFGWWGHRQQYFGMHDCPAQGLVYVAEAGLLLWAPRAVTLPLGALIVVLSPWILRLEPYERPLFGFAAAAIALGLPIPRCPRWLTWLAGCTYGIYLAHFGFVQVLSILDVMPEPYTPWSKLAVTVAIFVACVVVVALSRVTWLTQYLLLGERDEKAKPESVGTASTVPVSAPTAEKVSDR